MFFAADQFAVHIRTRMNMDSQHSDLQAVFTDLRSGVVPAMSTEELASQISSAINCSLHILLQSPHSMTSEDTEMTGMFLTLTGKIISTLSSKSLPGDVHVFYDEAMKKLFGASNLTADLVSVDFPQLLEVSSYCFLQFPVPCFIVTI